MENKDAGYVQGSAETPAQLERPRTFLRWKAFWYGICTCPALSWRHGEHLARRTRALLVYLGVWGAQWGTLLVQGLAAVKPANLSLGG